MQELKIGLFGMYGLYNYGCEAIVRGTYELIKQAWPNCEVVLYSYCPGEDQQMINNLNIIVKPVPMNKGILLRRIINKMLRTISVQKQFPMWDTKSVAEECDMVFSVGGDIYTIPQHILDHNKETQHSSIVEFGKTILNYKPLIIWGASIGPFGNKLGVREYYFDHLKNVKQIFCREEKTFEYLNSNGVTSNLQLCADPAFYIKDVVTKKNYKKSHKLRIALNLSPLSIREQIGEKTGSFQVKVVKTIQDLLTIPNSEILLIPHVLSPLSQMDNDLNYLKEIYNKIPTIHHKYLTILEGAKGFLGTKEILRTCDLVIAARMHCAINAICEGIPTIFLCYSQKGFGMADYIYGNSNWAIQLTEMENELKNKVIEMVANRESLSEAIKAKVSQIQSDESRIVNLFKALNTTKVDI